MALIGISNLLPQNTAQLLQIPGVGKATLSRYGEDILQIVQECIQKFGYEVKEFVIQHETASNKKEQKTDTKEQSFLLFEQGKNIEEIAKERSLAVSTIEGHLLPYLRGGDILLEKLVAPEKAEKIKHAFRQNPNATGLSEIKAMLGDGFSYGEIRFVNAVMGNQSPKS
jgi:uncharacterized protein YpbB